MAEKVTEKKENLEEEVIVTIPKKSSGDTEAVVILNGTAIKVPKGKPVKVKRRYANIIMESLRLKAEADDNKEAKAN